MVRGILGKKVGMTQIFDDEGSVIPVTVIEAGPCVVVQRKSQDSDGYEMVQIGLVERRPKRHASKAIIGHFSAAGVPPTRFVAEVPVDANDESKPGDSVLADIFATTSAAAAPPTARCFTARLAPSVVRRTRRGCSRDRACPARWATSM
jgi:large subunit ribosomal protein L3